ncbi:hypothetical protein [Archangium sp.]|uniref:hypothetical protein n=1 Tax=Archangium sp. TaxID=1872627 RepID=UPI002D363705|nr:hypothetical protein [Archangium sp.]HYO59754.1 hypothetical protein [Archangium sp.]
MSTRDDKKDLNMAGAPIPADRYGGRAERVAEAEDQDAEKAGTKLTAREERGDPDEGGEEGRVSDQPPERNIHPRK